jgi:hypothetical protein
MSAVEALKGEKSAKSLLKQAFYLIDLHKDIS